MVTAAQSQSAVAWEIDLVLLIVSDSIAVRAGAFHLAASAAISAFGDLAANSLLIVHFVFFAVQQMEVACSSLAHLQCRRSQGSQNVIVIVRILVAASELVERLGIVIHSVRLLHLQWRVVVLDMNLPDYMNVLVHCQQMV